MAGSGNYLRPSQRIKRDLQKLYVDQHAMFEVTGILLVFSGLILNIDSANGYVGESIRLLQFFSLAGASIALINLIHHIIGVLMTPLLEWLKVVQRGNPAHEGRNLFQSLAVLLFPLTILFLLIISLLVYLVNSYFAEFRFLFLLFWLHVIVFFGAGGLGRYKTVDVLFAFSAFGFLVVAPILLYCALYFPNLLYK